MKYRITECQDEGMTRGWWYFAPVDLRRKYYHCGHCQKEHLTKEGVISESNYRKNLPRKIAEAQEKL
jgi:hypothetical protein